MVCACAHMYCVTLPLLREVGSCVSSCVYVCVYVCMYVCVCVCLRGYVCKSVLRHTTSLKGRRYVYVYGYFEVYICMCVYVCVCVCMNMYCATLPL